MASLMKERLQIKGHGETVTDNEPILLSTKSEISTGTTMEPIRQNFNIFTQAFQAKQHKKTLII